MVNKVTTKFTTLFTKENPLRLENGELFSPINVAYQTYGELNEQGTNAVVVCHALTGNAHAAGYLHESEIENTKGDEFLSKYVRMNKTKPGWWDDLIGKYKAVDTSKHFVICSNFIGSCYGSSGPADINPDTNKKYNLDFPIVTVRDMVRVQKALLDELGVKKVEFAIGGSLGGMQVLEWAILYPDFIEKIIPIASSSGHSAWAIGLNDIARSSIMTDANWRSGNYTIQPKQGLALARKTAMMSYRSMPSFEEKFSRKVRNNNSQELFEVESYLNYQGEKFISRFDANTYIYITYAMDKHDVSKDRDSVKSVLSSIKAKTLVVGIDSDLLYPADEQKQIAELIPGAEYKEIKSIHGHDAFLIEFEQLAKLVTDFIQ